jgi:methionyl aminopeptidase
MDNWIKAGKIAKETREYGFSLIKEGENIGEVLDKVEAFLREKGTKPAFPPQISINNLAAHYAAFPGDETTIKKGDVVKLDLGINIEGAIADTAITREVGTNNHETIIKASKEALEAALKLATPGTPINEIGKAIDAVAKKYKVHQITNLSGHEIQEYAIHGGMTIPTYDNKDTTKLKENQVIAIEPFMTTGEGRVREGKPSSIYRITNNKQVRTPMSRKILTYIKKEYVTLPFSARQLANKFPLPQVRFTLNLLEKEGIVIQYPQLPETSNGIVAQTEHTVIVKDTPIITTL